MKKRIRNIAALGTAAVVFATCIMAYSTPSDKVYGEEQLKKVENTLTGVIDKTVKMTGDSSGADKEETVYVIADANGAAEEKIVSVWLRNKEGEDTISDIANLKDIQNVKGDEEFTQDDERLTWQANGSDIYYTGESEEQLPVDVKITYFLDGEEIDAKELAGKSGKVTIKFEYTNNSVVEKEVNGKKEKVSTPFLMVSGMMLPTDTFTNIEVTNGKVLNDGDKAIVVGAAFPGLNDDMKLSELSDKLDVEFPEEFEVTADVEDFELLMTLTMGTTEIFGGINTEDIDDATDTSALTDMIDKVSDALLQLSDGSGQLTEGLTQLSTNMKDFKTATDKFSDGLTQYTSYVDKFDKAAAKIAESTSGLNDKVPTLVAGIEELNAGISLLRQSISEDKKNTTLLAGATQVNGGVKKLQSAMNKMYGSLDENIKTYQSNIQKLTEGIEEAKTQLKTAAEGVKQYKDGLAKIKAAATGYVAAGDLQTAVGYYAKLDENYEKLTQVYDQMLVGYEQLLEYEEKLGQCEGAVSALTTIKGEMDEGKLIENLKTLKAGTQAVQDGIKKLSVNLNKKLAPGMQKLADEAGQLPDGISKLSGYMTQLSDGITQLAEKSSELTEGAAQIIDAEVKLKEGVDKLKDGSTKLGTGIGQLRSEATDKLSKLTDADIDAAVERVKATTDAAKEYTSFSGLSEGKQGTVKFIYRTEQIK